MQPAHPSGQEPAIRRIVTSLLTSLVALALLTVPAWAGSSISPAEAKADTQRDFTITITEPDGYQTQTVTVTAPEGFSDMACPQLSLDGWSCQSDGTTATFERLVGPSPPSFSFRVTTASINDTYAFRVTQRDGDGKNPKRSSPTVTITGGEDPAPADSGGSDETSGSGSSSDSGSNESSSSADGSNGSSDSGSSGGTSGDTSDGGSSSSGEEASGETSSSSSSSSSDSSGGASDDGSSSSSSSSRSSGGSTAPSRTQGFSSGSTLQITPGESADGEDPSIADPEVADAPVVAPPSEGDDTGTATMTAISGGTPEQQPADGGLPWQQLTGAALLLTGGAVAAIRRWDLLARLRNADLPGRLRGWRAS